MAFTPSVGDILMLSQTAWKIGRAFTQGKKNAVTEFLEVEREANSLSEALKLVAETLYSDSSTMAQAEDNTKIAVSTILESAHKTLSDLESFVDRYRVMKKKETKGGFVVERAWSEVVIANYRTLKWTTEGGDICELRNMLQMHTNSINLTMQALQSKSLDRLERTVVPMAENITAIHDRVNGDLGAKIDDLHRLIMSVANSTPSLLARDMNSHEDISARSIFPIDASPVAMKPPNNNIRAIEPPPRASIPAVPIRNPNRHTQSPRSFDGSRKANVLDASNSREDSAYFSTGSISGESNGGKYVDWGFESGSPPDRDSVAASPSIIPGSGTTANASPSPHLLSSASSSRRASTVPRRESATLPTLFSTLDDAAEESWEDVVNDDPSLVSRSTLPPQRQDLPPPALSSKLADDGTYSKPATPSSIFAEAKRKSTASGVTAKEGSSIHHTKSKASRKRESLKSTYSQTIDPSNQTFEKCLFRNAAILCDVRGSSVEYAQHVPDEPDPRYDTEMVEACKECRIYVIRKREHRPQGGMNVVTSIWTISDDGAVRCQQRLSEISETVPYCSYFQPEKVSLPPTDGEMTLRFHAENWGDEIGKEAKSNWINYIFQSEEGANQFQSAVFGRTLLGSFRTTKTTVIHEGLKGAFAFEEQFANIEVLRLWEDDGITTAGGGGGVLALMHLGSNFGEGWARWWMNSSKQQIRVKDEQTKFARIKGIDVRTVRPGTSDRSKSQSATGDALQRRASEMSNTSKKKGSEKRVTGVRIEFKNEIERANFVALANRVRQRMLNLPDL